VEGGGAGCELVCAPLSGLTGQALGWLRLIRAGGDCGSDPVLTGFDAGWEPERDADVRGGELS
jgi:hypothetical protein